MPYFSLSIILQPMYYHTDIDDCEGVNCNDGQCIDGVDSYRCDCDVGFNGDHCEISESYKIL